MKKSSFDPSSFVVPSIQSLPKSGIREFFDLVNARKDIISLGVGEPDFVTPTIIRTAAVASLINGETKYTSNAGNFECRKAITDYVAQYFKVAYRPEDECLVTVGVSEALDLAIRALVNPGDEVIYVSPCFVSYPAEVLMAHGTPVPLVTREEDQFSVDPAELEKLITPKSKILLFNTPNNPTGAAIPLKTLKKIAEIAIKHNLIVITDEIYAELRFDGELNTIAALPGMKERTIFLDGFSKSYAMTGFRLGYACGPAPIIDAMFKIHQYSIMCPPTTAQQAAVCALKSAGDEMEKMRQSYEDRCNLFYQGMIDAGLPCVKPQGAFYIFPRVDVTGLTSRQFAEKLLFDEGVAVVPGEAFGPGGEGYVRCCYATAREDLEKAIRKIKKLLKNL